MKKCDLPKSALFQSAKIIVQNAENALKAVDYTRNLCYNEIV